MVIAADGDDRIEALGVKWRIQDRALNRPARKTALRKTMIETVGGSLSDVEAGIACCRLGDPLPNGPIAQPNFKNVAIV